MKLDVGEVVRISDLLCHDSCYCGQTGVIYQYDGFYDGEDHYYIVVYGSGRFWGCGFSRSEFQPLGFKLEGLISAYAYWLSNDCWRNTDHTRFNKFMKVLKKIRKKYRMIVKDRM